MAYKKNIDDVRESPALDIMTLLKRRGALITYTDPYVPELLVDGVCLNSQEESVAAEADCVVIVTDHSRFNYVRLASEARLIVDTRNALKGQSGPNIVRL